MSVKFTYILDINLLNIAINHQMNEINTFLEYYYKISALKLLYTCFICFINLNNED